MAHSIDDTADCVNLSADSRLFRLRRSVALFMCMNAAAREFENCPFYIGDTQG